MQLCGILKNEKNHIRKKCCQVISFLLVILFTAMTVVQAFHAHDTVVSTNHADQCLISYGVEKCEICDFYLHKRCETIHPIYPPVLVTPFPTTVIHNSQHYIGNYKFTLQNFTNKGPPELLS